MAKQSVTDVEVRLGRLWKGTLLVAVVGAYALLVALLFVHEGWRAALLGLFFVIVAQFFRYIANDVDRIGWNLARQRGGDGGDAEKRTARYQGRLFWLLVGLAQLLNLALVGQAFALAGAGRALATLVGLSFVELLFWNIRQVNRRVEFRQASYGTSDGMLREGTTAANTWDETRLNRLNRQLERLKNMADAGEISQRAYRKTRDKWLVRSVMDEDGKSR